MTAAPQRFGHIALVGAPNTGKSTLVNALVGQKISIVSSKPQTTRSRITAIALHEQAQLVLVDTPGLFEGDVGALSKHMRRSIRDGLQLVDAVCLLLDAKQGDAARKATLTRVLEFISTAASPVPLLLCFTKTDLIKKGEVLERLEWAARECPEAHSYHALAAPKGGGLPVLLDTLSSLVPAQPWRFDPEQISTLPMQLLAAECTREQLFQRLHQELPYGVTVMPQSWEEKPRRSPKIYQQILVSRGSHKPMVIGRGGATLKAIGEDARAAIGELLGKPVHLFLHVKVEPNWETMPEYQALLNPDM